MNYATICSGIGAPECAWHDLGWFCQFCAEIDPFASAIHAHHFPTVPNLGDITKFKDWIDYAIDILVGGTPCQGFSIAGRRKGMGDSRSALLLSYLAIIERYAPAWIVWENVPGVLSVNERKDFACFLDALAKRGYGFAYRILDAQYFGVAQRRERVFVVGHSGGQWQRAAAVLYDSQSLRWNPPPSRAKRQTAAASPERGAYGDSAALQTEGLIHDVCPPLEARTKAGGGGWGTDFLADGGMVPEIVSQAISAKWHKRTSGPAGDECQNLIPDRQQVRRLTPLECERLMGFPDHWTNVQYKGKPAADAPRYRVLGNSMAVPCMRWLGQRIALVQSLIDNHQPRSRLANERRFLWHG